MISAGIDAAGWIWEIGRADGATGKADGADGANGANGATGKAGADGAKLAKLSQGLGNTGGICGMVLTSAGKVWEYASW